MGSDALGALLVILAADISQALFAERKVRHLQTCQANIRKKLASARAEAAKCNSPATFTQSAKHQRRGIALEKELASVEQEQADVQGSWIYRSCRMAKFLVTLLLVLRWWGEPVLVLGPDAVFPLGQWLAAPHSGKLKGPGAVTALPWLALCQRASKTVVGAVLLG